MILSISGLREVKNKGFRVLVSKDVMSSEVGGGSTYPTRNDQPGHGTEGE